jgi:uncharacterized protein (TIGR03435 family)
MMVELSVRSHRKLLNASALTDSIVEGKAQVVNNRSAQSEFWGRRLLCVAAMLFAATMAGAQSPEAGAKQYRFEVATIKPNVKHDGSWRLEFTPDGFTAMGVPLRKMVEEAYGTYNPEQWAGLPPWGGSELFDIETKFDAAAVANYKDLSMDQRRRMLQTLLAERFKVAIHHEKRDIDAFALVVVKGGPKIKQTPPEKVPEGDVKGYDGLVTKSGRGVLEGTGISMKAFAEMLHYSAGRLVLDKTGLPGRYDISLRWTPDDLSPTIMSALDTGGPSLFSALQEQLGLKLQLGKFPVDVLVIDRAERPSEN